jgi:hypothetical protein
MENNNSNNEPLTLSESFAPKKFAPKKPKNFFNIVEGDNIYFPLPPHGALAESKIWIVKNVVHWGLVSSQGKARPFLCPGFGCAKCAYDKAVKTTLESLNQKTDADTYKLLKEYLDTNQIAITYDMNVVNQENKIGLLKIKKRMFDSLAAEEKAVAKYGIHFASPTNGTWINFKKTGSGTTATWDAKALRETREVEGSFAEVLKKTPVSKEVLVRMNEEAFDLNHTCASLTHDQVKTLVANIIDYTVDPEFVDQLFAQNKPSGTDLTFPGANVNVNVVTEKSSGVKTTDPSDPLSKYF